MDDNIRCNWCNSADFKKAGIRKNKDTIKQVYKCKNCKSKFSTAFFKPLEETEPNERVTYPQVWPAYNKAQSSEKLLFLQITTELALMSREQIRNKVGRPQVDLNELVFCCCLKIYSGLSGRRLISDLDIAREQGFISETPHFNTVLKYFNSDEITSILQEMVKLSALPLKEIEEQFATDATGFSTSQFSRWFDHRWGKDKTKRIWVKAHAMIGTITNAVTAIEITPGHKADCPQFVHLLNQTHENGFNIREISADRAYLSRKNMKAADDIGATPFIPFKKNSKRRAARISIWKKMYAYFQLHREEFMMHYHRRSNVETTFAMIKKKFGNNVRSKTFTGQKNEILCKVICHNICCLIQECFERDVKLPINAELASAQIRDF